MMEFIQEIKNRNEVLFYFGQVCLWAGIIFLVLSNLSVENLRHKRMVQTF
jgi:hypothetical protein